MGSIDQTTETMPSKIRQYVMPAEHDLQSHTLMAYPSIDSADNESELRGMQAEIIALAKAISKFQPVHLYSRPSLAAEVKAQISDNTLLKEGSVDQLWIRDSGPVYVKDEHGIRTGVNFNFNYWGGKLPRTGDEKLVAEISEQTKEPSVISRLITEGGAIEVDGEGTFLGTESSTINANRNPGMSKAEIERELSAILGVKQFIWLPGIVGGDITDDHIDAIARFVKPGVVFLQRPGPSESEKHHESYRKSKSILDKAKDAKGRSLVIHECEGPDHSLLGPSDSMNSVVASYANYLLVNGGMIFPKFGQDEVDRRAFELVKSLFPEREVVQVHINMLPRCGGGIHCSTQHVPI